MALHVKQVSEVIFCTLSKRSEKTPNVKSKWLNISFPVRRKMCFSFLKQENLPTQSSFSKR